MLGSVPDARPLIASFHVGGYGQFYTRQMELRTFFAFLFHQKRNTGGRRPAVSVVTYSQVGTGQVVDTGGSTNDLVWSSQYLISIGGGVVLRCDINHLV